MFFLLKLSVLTCVFYLGFTLLLEAGILAAAHISGIIGINFSRSVPFWIFFALVWVGSFSLAWHITYSQYLARLQELKAASSIFINY
jgi:hypothetical protein